MQAMPDDSAQLPPAHTAHTTGSTDSRSRCGDSNIHVDLEAPKKTLGDLYRIFRWKEGLGWAITRYAEVLVRAPLALAHVGVEAQTVLVQVAEHVADNATPARV